MINISKNGKVKVRWEVGPYDYSPEKEKEIIAYFAKKYGIKKDSIKVVQDHIVTNTKGESISITDQVIDNIQDPAFQEKLFKEYLEINNIENYDYELISSIDKSINGQIDYQVYDKLRRYSIKWIKWSNFRSYGTDNYFDFRNLKELVLLNGEPANQSGKTTFTVELLHFLLFGSIPKVKTQEEIFNHFLPEATNVTVEGCISINGEDYIIKRTLSRPKFEKRTDKSKTTQKVEYFRLVGDSTEELEDYVEMENGVDVRQTNKIIKESIGKEEDFDLIMCITGSNLHDLIEEKPTDRGRLFSRWIGLLPLEAKDQFAREKFNQAIKPSLMSNQFDRETLAQEIEAYKVEIKESEKTNKSLSFNNSKIDEELVQLEEDQKRILASKENIDKDVLKLDISTLRLTMESKLQEGKQKKAQLDKVIETIKEFGEINFSVEEYDKMIDEKTQKLLKQQSLRQEAVSLQKIIKQLKTSEYCPTCGKKFDNVDNSKQIEEHQAKLDELIKEGVTIKAEVEELEKKILAQKELREKYTQLNSLNNQKPVFELNLEKLRAEYRELKLQEQEYIKNSEAIDKNNNLDIAIRNLEVNIKTKRGVREQNINLIAQNKANIERYKRDIEQREKTIVKINEEEKIVYNWKIYLDMVGKNGISKMIMRKALPIINARLSTLLEDVCDFDVVVEINSRNEVAFRLVKDGISSDLNSSGSGFEKTAAALALRSVLADISTIPSMNFIVLDEILSGVSFDNYENIFNLIQKTLKSYDFAFFITHVDAVKTYAKSTVTIKKEDNISRIISTGIAK